jgi:DNA-binding NarL/FixJ family response regulator
VIGEDEALLREGLMFVLRQAGIDVAGVTDEAPDLAQLVAAHDPDLVITDIRMPPGHADDGLRAALAIHAERPGLPLMVLSQYVNRQYAQQLLADGSAAVGYLLKQRVAGARSFCADLERVAAGGTVLDQEVVAAMMARARRDDAALSRLTARQLEVLALLAEGRSNAGIARRLVITEKAVVQHVSRIYDQLGIAASDDDHRRVLAVMRYLAR